MDKAYYLEDSTINTLPETVTTLSRSNLNNIQTPMDHLAFLLHCLMMECGFSTDEDDKNIFKLCDSKAGIYRFKYFISCDVEERKICSLVLTSVGSLVIVIGNCMDSKKATFGIKFYDISGFIANCTNPNFPSRFRNLRSLSFYFKTLFAMPLLSLACQILDLTPGTQSFMSLPEEVRRMIVKKITSAKDVLRLGKTCKSLQELCDANEVWKVLFKNYFRDQMNGDLSHVTNWKDEFLRNYRIRRIVTYGKQNATHAGFTFRQLKITIHNS